MNGQKAFTSDIPSRAAHQLSLTFLLHTAVPGAGIQKLSTVPNALASLGE